MRCWPGPQCLASMGNSRAETVTNNCPDLARESGWEFHQWHLVQSPKVSVHKVQKIVQALVFPIVQFVADHKGHEEADELVCWIVMGIIITMSRLSTDPILTLENVSVRILNVGLKVSFNWSWKCARIEGFLLFTCSEDFVLLIPGVARA